MSISSDKSTMNTQGRRGTRHARFLVVGCAALLLGSTSLLTAQKTPPSTFAGDIVCSNGTRYLVPGQCRKSCTGMRTLANLSGGQCSLKLQTRALKQDKNLPLLYNQAMFGSGVVGGVDAETVLACELINNFYDPNKCPDFTVSFGESKERWAGLECEASSASKPTLTLTSEVFLLTPAYLALTVGHEMVHAGQCKRTYKVTMMGLDAPHNAFRELEAYSWESSGDSFPRKFKVKGTDLENSLQSSEKAELASNYTCAQWDVLNALAEFVKGPRYSKYGKNLLGYMQQDPWISQVWLPNNPNWDKQSPGPQPAGCEN